MCIVLVEDGQGVGGVVLVENGELDVEKQMMEHSLTMSMADVGNARVVMKHS